MGGIYTQDPTASSESGLFFRMSGLQIRETRLCEIFFRIQGLKRNDRSGRNNDERSRSHRLGNHGQLRAETSGNQEAGMEPEEGAGVFIIIGRVWAVKEGPETPVHILLVAPDDDSAIRTALDALSERGFEEAEFDQIGSLVDAPDEEPHASAYQGALEGEVAVVTFAEGLADQPDISDEDDDYDPFAVLKDWKPDGR
jgi:hypothetical protein